MSARAIILAAIAVLTAGVYIMAAGWHRSREKVRDLEKKLKEARDASDRYRRQAEAYAEEMKKHEQNLQAINNHDDSGFSAGVDLLQQLHESGAARNRPR